LTATIVQLQKKQEAQFLCSACGADRSCNCNAPAIPKGQQAIEALKANPEKSDRAIAKEIGASPTTVGKAREELSSGGQLKEPRVGLDGRARKQPAAKPKKKSKKAEPAAAAETTIDEAVEYPAIVLNNILDSIKHAKSVAEAYRKILKASTFDREAKKQINTEIDLLIRKWRTVQSTLTNLAAEPAVDDPTASAEKRKAEHAASEAAS
jgi:DNA-binding Lrp family transcriptional regulator